MQTCSVTVLQCFTVSLALVDQMLLLGLQETPTRFVLCGLHSGFICSPWHPPSQDLIKSIRDGCYNVECRYGVGRISSQHDWRGPGVMSFE